MDFNVIPSDVALLMGLGSQAQYPLHHFKLDLQASSASFICKLQPESSQV